MSINIKNKRSAVLGSVPTPSQLDDGEFGVNFNDADPALYIKDSAGAVVRLAGGGAVGDKWEVDGTTLKPIDDSYDVNIGGTLPSASAIQLRASGSAEFASNIQSESFTGVSGGSVNSRIRSDGSATFGSEVLLQNDSGSQLILEKTGTQNPGTVSLKGGDFGDATLDYTRQLYIKKGGTEQLRVSTAGDILIGGTLPSAPNISLDANGSADFTNHVTNNNTSFTVNSTRTNTGYKHINVISTVLGDPAIQDSSVFSVLASGGIRARRGFNLGGDQTDTGSNISLDGLDGSSEFTGDMKIGGTLPSAPAIELNADGSSSFSGQASLKTDAVYTYPGGSTPYGDLSASTVLKLSNTDNTVLGTGSFIEFAQKGTNTNSTSTYVGTTVRGNTEGADLVIAVRRQGQSGAKQLVNVSAQEGSVSIGGTLPSAPATTLNGDGSATFTKSVRSVGSQGDDPSTGEAGVKLSKSGALNITSDPSDTALFIGETNGTGANTTYNLQALASGDLLIGGTLPSAPAIQLKANGSAKYTSAEDFSLNSAGGLFEIRSEYSSTPVTGSNNLIRLVSQTTNSYAAALISLGKYENNSNARSELTFKVANSSLSAGLAEFKFRGDGKALFPGKVLIGGTLPSAPAIELDGGGGATFSSNVNVGARLLTRGTFVGAHDADNSVGFQLYGTSGTSNRGLTIGLGSTGGTDNALVRLDAKHSTNGSLVFATKSIDRLYIDKSGDIKIGGTLPASPKTTLAADGSAEFTGNIDIGSLDTSSTSVSGARIGASGYVFAQRPDGDNGYLWRGYQGTTTTSFITGNGDATFSGLLKADTLRPLNADSAAAPGLCVYNEVDTGFFRPSSDNIGITTKGIERARVNSSGNLLIGGSLPSSPTIELNANGQATFEGDIFVGNQSTNSDTASGVRVQKGGQIKLQRPATTATGNSMFEGYRGSTKTSIITVGGAANFAGSVFIGGTLPSAQAIQLTSDGKYIGTKSVTVERTANNNPLFVGKLNGSETFKVLADGSAEYASNLNVGPGNPTNGESDGARISSTGQLIVSRDTGENCFRTFTTGTSTATSTITSDGEATFAGDITCSDNSKGLVLKSPDGTSFRLSVANDGTLSASSA